MVTVATKTGLIVEGTDVSYDTLVAAATQDDRDLATAYRAVIEAASKESDEYGYATHASDYARAALRRVEAIEEGRAALDAECRAHAALNTTEADNETYRREITDLRKRHSDKEEGSAAERAIDARIKYAAEQIRK